MIDYIIVGQGIAGSLLAFKLLQKGHSVKIFDESAGATSSSKAAGIINPITGKRFVKSWKIDDLLPTALSTYNSIEKIVQKKFTERLSNFKIIHSIEQLNDVKQKMNDEKYQNYLNSSIEKLEEDKYENKYGAIKIKNLLRIDVSSLLNELRAYFLNLDCLIEKRFSYDEVELEKSVVSYQSIQAKRIIFCEGFQLAKNPYFNYLPMRSVKGEALIIKANDLQQENVISARCNITPFGNDLYYVGSTYDWKDKTLDPTELKKQELIKKLQESIKTPYSIEKHIAGIRPASLDRRPFIGKHPKFKNLYIFNGMGTKGYSLSPYFSEQLINLIEKNKELSASVSIERYQNYFDKNE